MASPREKNTQKKSKQAGGIENQPAPVDLNAVILDAGGWVSTAFGRFKRDFLGIMLIVLAVLTLFALAGWTGGTLLKPYGIFLWRQLGWGAALVALAAGLGGVQVIRKKPEEWSVHAWRKVLVLEGMAFTALTILSVVGGVSLDRAEAGLDGGIIGWGLAYFLAIILGPFIRDALLFLLFLILAIDFFGGWDVLRKWARTTVEAEQINPPASGQTAGRERSVSEAATTSSVETAKAKNRHSRLTEKLPAEYRKSFRVENVQPEKPAAPRPRDERLPPLNLLMGEQSNRPDERFINQTAGLIEKTLAEFGIPAKVSGFRIGPTVTQFAVEPGYIEKSSGAEGEAALQKVRVAQIAGLQKDLALALSAERLRIVAPVPGRAYVGIEVPNMRSTIVRLRSILESDTFNRLDSPLAVALGRDVSGQPVVADLAKMPHLLIAGTTGSGKSVSIAALTTCLVMNNTPDDLRLVMIDPKMVELVRFNGLPHLFGKVETEVERILGVLQWAMTEMDHRYRMLEAARARDILAYNARMQRRGKPTLPRIVIIVDELADLMMTAPEQTEHSLVRLAQMARATGMHMVLATQRPSTDVVTGLIKANFPARISFTVASSVDSRVILDTTGAEDLLGRGDMLFVNPEVGSPIRTQGVMITDQELERVVAFWQKMSPVEEVEKAPWEEIIYENEEGDSGSDALIDQAIEIVRQTRRASASLLQRRLRIGYPRAARLIDELEELGVVGPSQGGGREREVLPDPDDAAGEAEAA